MKRIRGFFLLELFLITGKRGSAAGIYLLFGSFIGPRETAVMYSCYKDAERSVLLAKTSNLEFTVNMPFFPLKRRLNGNLYVLTLAVHISVGKSLLI